MAKLGIRKFADLVGRTDLLKPREVGANPKAKMLNFAFLLKNALHMRPGVNIRAGSETQVRRTLFRISLAFFSPEITRTTNGAGWWPNRYCDCHYISGYERIILLAFEL